MRSFPYLMPPIFLMKTTTDTESIITQLNRARFQLLTVIFPHNHHHSLCTFPSDEQEPVCPKRCKSEGDKSGI
jgi:hypothetical protein